MLYGNLIDNKLQVLTSIFTTINSSCSSHCLILLSVSHLGQVIMDYIYLIRGTKYTCVPSWLATWSTHVKYKLYPLMLVSLTLHAWLSLFLPHETVASLPAGVMAYLATFVMCISLHPMVSSMMSRYERSVTQSALTWCSLLLASVHAVMSDWSHLTSVECLPSPHQISLVPPVLTIFLQVKSLTSMRILKNNYIFAGTTHVALDKE